MNGEKRIIKSVIFSRHFFVLKGDERVAEFHWKKDKSKVVMNDFIHQIWTAKKWNELIDFLNSQYERIWNEREQQIYDDTYEPPDPETGDPGYEYPMKDYKNNYDVPAKAKANPNPGNLNSVGDSSLVTAEKYNLIVESISSAASAYDIAEHSTTVKKDDVILAMHANNLETDANLFGEKDGSTLA